MPSTRSRVVWTLALTAAAWLLVVPAAAAYIDPGTTGFIFQAAVAALAAAGLTIKTFWARLRGLFARSDNHPDPATTAPVGQHPPAGAPSGPDVEQDRFAGDREPV